MAVLLEEKKVVDEEDKGKWKVYKSDRDNMDPNWVAEKQSGDRRDVLWGNQGESEHGHSASDNEKTRWSRSTDGTEHQD